MSAAQKVVETERRSGSETSAAAELAELLRPGLLVVEGGRSGRVAFADPRAMELLACADRASLERLWGDLRSRLEAAGAFGAEGGRAMLDAGDAPGGARLAFDWRPGGSGGGGGGVLLIHDAAVTESLVADLRQASLLRSVSQITPAVAHDLRAPINAMVFNIEVLKETISSGRGDRDRYLRYIGVLRDELHRLHQGVESYIAQISPRGDREETLDLREPLTELAALLVGPARKQQARVAAELPEAPVRVTGNRFLIRQAFLHLAVAALGGVQRDGVLEIRLERRNGRAQVRFTGGVGTMETLGAAETAGGAEGGAQRPGFGISASPRGSEAQLWAARGIVAGLGGEVRELGAAGAPAAYEVELAVAPDIGSPEKE
jgi:signal transduction histidine kinase